VAGVTALKRVVVADDQVAVRAGVRVALHGRGFVVCAEAANAAGAVAAVAAERPDVCLLDIDMPGNGLQAVREIKRRFPDVAIVILTVSESPDDFIESLRAGADGYLLKTIAPARLAAALDAVLAGEASLPRGLSMSVVEELRRSPRSLRTSEALTAREEQILELLREGLSTAEIAHALDVAPVTVRTHVAALLRKLGAKNRAAVLALLNER